MELISIPTVPKVRALLAFSSRHLKLSKYRDPLHVILEYIAEVRAVHKTYFLSARLVLIWTQERPNCDTVIVHDDDLALLDLLGDGAVSRSLSCPLHQLCLHFHVYSHSKLSNQM
jgi:hypothetical protein